MTAGLARNHFKRLTGTLLAAALLLAGCMAAPGATPAPTLTAGAPTAGAPPPMVSLPPTPTVTAPPPTVAPTLPPAAIQAQPPTPVPSPAATATPLPLDRPAADAAYRLIVDLDYACHSAHVTQTMQIANYSGDVWTEVVFHVPVSRVAGAFVLERAQASDGVPLAYTADAVTLAYTLTLPRPAAPGARVDLELAYTLTLPHVTLEDWPPTGDAGWGDHVIQFGNWYPALVPYRAGQGWYTWPFAEVGDPYVSEVATYDLEVRAAPDLVVASGGLLEYTPGVWRFHLDRARAEGFTASPEYELRASEVAGIPVYSYYLAAHERAGTDVFTATLQSLELFSRLYGPYPYDSFTVAENAFFGSMEYTGFASHSGSYYATYDGQAASTLIALTAQEVAHQWFYSLVGNDQVREPWLDESFGMYSELAFYRGVNPDLEQWFWDTRVYKWDPEGPLDRTIYDFPDSMTYIHELYRQGVIFLDRLQAAMGDDEFFAFVRAWRTRGESRIATAGEFFDLLGEYQCAACEPLLAEFFTQPAPAPGAQVWPNGATLVPVRARATQPPATWQPTSVRCRACRAEPSGGCRCNVLWRIQGSVGPHRVAGVALPPAAQRLRKTAFGFHLVGHVQRRF